MCTLDACVPATSWLITTPTARANHVCRECFRVIARGETYHHYKWLYRKQWSRTKVCRHCAAAGEWIRQLCGAWPLGGLTAELAAHPDIAARSIAFARIVIAQRRGWRDGLDPVPAPPARATEQQEAA